MEKLFTIQEEAFYPHGPAFGYISLEGTTRTELSAEATTKAYDFTGKTIAIVHKGSKLTNGMFNIIKLTIYHAAPDSIVEEFIIPAVATNGSQFAVVEAISIIAESDKHFDAVIVIISTEKFSKFYKIFTENYLNAETCCNGHGHYEYPYPAIGCMITCKFNEPLEKTWIFHKEKEEE